MDYVDEFIGEIKVVVSSSQALIEASRKRMVRAEIALDASYRALNRFQRSKTAVEP